MESYGIRDAARQHKFIGKSSRDRLPLVAHNETVSNPFCYGPYSKIILRALSDTFLIV